MDSTNTDVAPLFADPDNGDYHLKSEHGRWNPNANGGAGDWVLDNVTSLCVNGGDPASDFSNEPMFNGGRINVGAYGNTPEASKNRWLITTDANFDEQVDVLDLLTVRDKLQQDPTSGNNWRCDVNTDGFINILDLIYVRNHLRTRRE
ncbi:MAG: hypothetical protein HQ592_17395 [Planctomycetes bacterium]|nr:hypothetical protein [Planctomycetota bacterium]